jgi:TPP-dependent pyruvate/acetoin dehydrogenase alpha subunit
MSSETRAHAHHDLIKIYRLLVQTRLFEARVVALNRQGKISIYATSEGEEAIAVAAASAMGPGDWLFPDYRSTGALFARGVSMSAYLSQLLGTGCDLSKGRQMPTHYASRDLRVASVSTPVGNGIVHAVGLAWAVKLRKGGEVVLVLFGDGATSSDGFHAGMNIAGVHRLPVVFLCRNNQYAISLPLSMQTASKTIAVKAAAYGFEGVQVDGNDALAVYNAARIAFDRARAGDGPTLIEAVSYRLGSHTTSDDARRYRADEQVSQWRQRDSLESLRLHLSSHGLWDDNKESDLRDALGREIDAAVDRALAEPPPPVSSLFEDVYSDVPPHLQRQREDLR